MEAGEWGEIEQRITEATALMTAATDGRPDILRLLLSKGAKVDIKDDYIIIRTDFNKCTVKPNAFVAVLEILVIGYIIYCSCTKSYMYMFYIYLYLPCKRYL